MLFVAEKNQLPSELRIKTMKNILCIFSDFLYSILLSYILVYTEKYYHTRVNIKRDKVRIEKAQYLVWLG